ncbi:hypothetical protein ASPWEDRAFT_165339 [Aspergillus wentii DTO 134E9]|uniref:NAD-dependent epimerase/dehydratase domain-containing protein n=1 Tax=Aspergillus wentii DTO 134E9 TaxID=1073089 RepID=A0A1L9R498_ASPWE|nr:uncharacterized protein ASPWEDRAFT_165339 [Aspergillus wentii DTO 134E9]KAI9926990.1 hypothetical protein MW887_003371 [Aspergillus wentii]OJJ29703.1 hypothetical protein ASPWEDRAFT_165339 [Aspergillus wentii DTO 134E9]
MSAQKVFLIGPGFIGGEVLDLLLQKNYAVTTLIRRQAAAASFHDLGVQTVIGTIDDKSIIQKQVENSDIVIHTATADHLPSVEAVLDGITARAHTGQTTIYIHTSGTSLLADGAHGDSTNETIFDDAKPQTLLNALPDSAAHREIDLAIINAQKALGPKAKMAIMTPPLIYGVSTREKRLSIQLPTMMRFSVKHGYAGHVGKGVAVWNQVHVKDLARGYLTLLDWLEKTPGEQVLADSDLYCFCENGQELSWGECAAAIGEALAKAKKIPSAQPRTIPREHYGDLFGEYSGVVIGSNSRSRAIRLRQLGWEPKEKGTIQSLIEDEIPLILQETGPFKGYSAPVASGDTK